MVMFEDKYDVMECIEEMIAVDALEVVRRGAIKEGKNMVTPNVLGVYRIKRGPLAGREVELSWGPTVLTAHPLTGSTLIMVGVSTADGSQPNGAALSLAQLDELLRWTEEPQDEVSDEL